jgi:two-component system nitrate/nitrite response regulator NarL
MMRMKRLKKIWLNTPFGRFLSPVKKYSILLVDDHRILLDGLQNLLSKLEAFDIKDTATTGEQALHLLKTIDYDVLITDYEMPGISGMELVRAAKAAQPDIKTIVLTMHEDPAVVREMLRIGVNGYILKKDTHKSLVHALEKVVENKRVLSDDVSEILIQSVEEEEKGVLTEREKEILRLVAKEYNSRQIAEILFISERTVETHRKNILRKTGASNLVGLIKYAYANNLI